MIRWTGCVCLAMITLGVAGCQRNQWWSRIESAGRELKYVDYDDEAMYWSEVLFEAKRALWSGIGLNGPSEAEWGRLVRHFGQHGPQADLRLLFSDPSLMSVRRARVDPAKITVERCGIDGAEFMRLRERAAKAVTLMLMDDVSLLRRYARAMVWSGLYVKPGDIMTVVLLAEKMEPLFQGDNWRDEEYWYRARKFLVLAGATGWTDRIQRCDVEDLRGDFREWIGWLRANRRRLKFDYQKGVWTLNWLVALLSGRTVAPFDDWSGPAPPTPGVVGNHGREQFGRP